MQKKDKEILKEILETALINLDNEDIEAWQVLYSLKRKLKINFSAN